MKSNFSHENQNFPVNKMEKEQNKRTDLDIEVAHLLVLLSNQNPNPSVSTFAVYLGNSGYSQQSEYNQAEYPPDPYHSEYHQSDYPPEPFHQADYHQADYHQADYRQAYPYNHNHRGRNHNHNQHSRNHNNNHNNYSEFQAYPPFSQSNNGYYESPYQQDKIKRGSSSPTSSVPPGTKKLVLAPSGLPCPNCGIETSTLWRNCDLLDGSKYLCNACGLRFKKGKYCPICYEVYYDADTNHFSWEQCRSCTNWTHKACIQKSSGLPTVFGYTCKLCSNGRGIISPQPMEQMKSYSVEKNRGGHAGV
jgi:predicted RNA-binding Zn-ribbon protein involved in translation (DUF1610 family)